MGDLRQSQTALRASSEIDAGRPCGSQLVPAMRRLSSGADAIATLLFAVRPLRRRGRSWILEAMSTEGRALAFEPADALLHPVTLLAIGILLLNDHVLKETWPGLVTGKLSDFAGLVFFPLLLTGAWELGLFVARRWHEPTAREVILAVIATGAGFVFVKTTVLGAEAFGWLLGALQWAIGLPPGLLSGHVTSSIRPASVVADPTDLVALPALLLPAWIGLRRAARSQELPTEQGIERP